MNGATMSRQEVMEALTEQVRLLRAGKTTPATANAVSNAVGKMFGMVRLELEYCKLTKQQPKSRFLELT